MSIIPTTSTTDPRVLAEAEALVGCTGPAYVRFGWDRLSVDQFMSTMRLALARDPIKVAAAWAQVQERLAGAPELQQELLRETVAKIKQIDMFAVMWLEPAPLEIRRAIVENLAQLPPYNMPDEAWWKQTVPALEVLVGVLYDLETEKERDEFLKVFIGTFAEVHPVLRYRSVRACIRRRPSRGLIADDVDQWLLQAARGWVKQSGYEIGIIRMGQHRGVSQPYVQLGQCKFVRDRRSHQYLPFEGDEVLFWPDLGTVLVKNRVVAVFFVPADR